MVQSGIEIPFLKEEWVFLSYIPALSLSLDGRGVG